MIRWYAAAAASAAFALAGCGGGDAGAGQVLRIETLQHCLTGKGIGTNVTRAARLPGANEPADLIDAELISPSAARLYVFRSVDAAKGGEAGAAGAPERRDNVVIVYDGQPTAADRAALQGCLSGRA
jgi:hypothetical protein